MAAVATAWVLHQPEVTAIVVGPSRVEHLEDARAGLDLSLASTELEELAGWFA
jgi:aryl-alcohol dehydrogenase-like predicted oxidoreductase